MTTSGLMQWINDNVIGLVILIVALFAFGHGRNGNISKVITIVATVLLALVVLALVDGGLRGAITNWFTGLIVQG